ncbi:hypothetical protein IAU60_005350 [Kwoniella sp. DSM 27419]
MPPRRLTRASLPAPSQVKSEHSTRVAKEEPESDALVDYGPSDSDGQPMKTELHEGSNGLADSPKYKLESVTIPSRRSRLGTDKTTSLENMTINGANGQSSTPADVKEDPEAITQDDVKPSSSVAPASTTRKKGRSKVNPSEQAPFNIGKHSAVSKAKASDLVMTPEEQLQDDSPPVSAKRARASYGAGKPRGRGKKALSPLTDESESEYEQKVGGDYAMDSDQEDEQLAKAIAASTKKARTSTGSSRASSSKSTPVKTRAGRGNQAALRAAVARAAEARATGQIANRGNTSGDVTPYSADGSGVGTNISALSDDDSGLSTVLSDISADEALVASDTESSYLSSSDSDAPLAKKLKGSKGKFAGRGQTVDGKWDEEIDDLLGSEGEGLDPEEKRMMTLQKLKAKARSERRAWEKAAAPRKKKEKELAKKLGRKLTNGEKNLIALSMSHPELEDVWGDLQTNVQPVKPVTMEAHPSLKLTLLPFQKESLYWMKKQEEGPWKGGMLADEMGMGKTIQTIALLLSEPRRKPSLVVAPVVALMQWKHEIETHAEGFTVCLWHGQGRMKAAELKKYDVVMVSYGTLEASFRRQQRGFKRGNNFIKEKSPMHEFEWYRVILDEAHNIKERSTNAAKAAFALHATYKWCLSGTPLQNRVGELYSLVRFLGADPFSHYFCKKCPCKSLHWQFKDKRTCDQCGHKPMDHVCFWNTEILTPIARYGIEEGGPGHTAFKKLKILLDRMMLRRTKLERADDLGLPPRTIVVRRDYFSPQEKELYMSLFTGAKRQFTTYIDQGTVLNNYSNIFSLITRMRQMACHPDLVLKSKNSALGSGLPEGTVCRLCNDTAEDAIMSACKHVFDRECIRQYLEVKQARGHSPECPVCHIEISIDLEAEAIDMQEDNKKARQGILSRLDLQNWRSSSKLEALVEELEKLRNKDCTIKSLVFSQFVSFLDLIAFRLQRAGFNICRLEGGMTPQQRDATIQHFMKNTHVTVFLISLKAGGVALNLTEASMVFMMDSWWNPSVEYQAMDRIHRLGQKRPVKVVKLVVEDSIEDQIVQLQQKKLAMTEAALNKDPDAALGKLTVEDLGFLFKL